MPRFVPKVFFFTGSSGVGKTTTLESLPKDEYDTVVLSARVSRAEMNNPAWADLMSDPQLAERHQKIVFKHFIDELSAHIHEFGTRILSGTCDKHLVFDRSLWDVAGYTNAFRCSDYLQTQMVSYVRDIFEMGLIDKGFVCRLVHFEINPSLPYELIPARPPAEIRDGCATALKMWLGIPLSHLVVIERNHANVSVEDFIRTLDN